MENSPSKVAAADQPLSNFFSTDAVVSAESCACAAPLTTKDAPGSVWEVAPIERICAALGGEPGLLIFDNCEHLLGGVAALVAELLRRCEAVSVLATSQEPLRIAAETTYRLEPLAVPQSAATDLRAL